MSKQMQCEFKIKQPSNSSSLMNLVLNTPSWKSEKGEYETNPMMLPDSSCLCRSQISSFGDPKLPTRPSHPKHPLIGFISFLLKCQQTLTYVRLQPSRSAAFRRWVTDTASGFIRGVAISLNLITVAESRLAKKLQRLMPHNGEPTMHLLSDLYSSCQIRSLCVCSLLSDQCMKTCIKRTHLYHLTPSTCYTYQTKV